MALIISTWRWGTKYDTGYVDKLIGGVQRNLGLPHIFMVFSPQPEDVALTEMRGCFCRLRMFSPQWQRSVGIEPGDRLVTLDLDIIITGKLDPLFERDESFVIWQGANTMNPCPYNGSVMMLRCGEHADVWGDFSTDAAAKAPYYEFPDDQGWIHHKLPNAASWPVGKQSGIYGFKKRGWPIGNQQQLPYGARIVCFPGSRDPSDEKYAHFPWIKTWRQS